MINKTTIIPICRRHLTSSYGLEKKLQGPSQISKAAISSLSRPKTERMHEENQMCHLLGISDPIDYARHKSSLLHAERLRKEAKRAEEDAERNVLHDKLETYKEFKEQVCKYLYTNEIIIGNMHAWNDIQSSHSHTDVSLILY